MINRNRLHAELALKGKTQKELCKDIGMAESTFIRKIQNDSFGTDEVKLIKKSLKIDMPTIVDIFLSE